MKIDLPHKKLIAAKRIKLLNGLFDANKETLLEADDEKIEQNQMKTWMVAAIDGRNDATQSAKTVAHCQNLMLNIRPFQRAVLFCNSISGSWPIEIKHIPKMDKNGYSHWCIKELWKHVTTDFVLIVQHDGYIINPQSWSEEFLNYDYIGAPWPHYLTDNGNVGVGNGGFSIRSKRLCKEVANCSLPHKGLNEDVYICRKMVANKAYSKEIKFAPVSVAAKFAVETWIRIHGEQNVNENNVFGFHMFGGPRRKPVK